MSESIYKFDYNELITHFSITNTSGINQISKKYKKRKINEIINEIDKYQKQTGIYIGSISILSDLYLYFLIFDDQIIIIDEINLPKFQLFFNINNEENKFFFLNQKVEEKVNEIKRNSVLLNQNEISPNFTINGKQSIIQSNIEKQISQFIIKKSQIRTLERYRKSKLENFQSNKEFKKSDFIEIKTIKNNVKLCFNVKDQFLYILKYFEICDKQAQKQYHHEISFYQKINNKNSFISKFYGKIDENELKILIIEYIEGDTLINFIKKRKNHLSFSLKHRIIFQIITTVEFIHSNGIILRDLKDDNIIIDSDKNSIFIDFDQTHIIGSETQTLSHKHDMTGDIGSLYYTAHEQFSTNNYSTKVDIYSLGMIIHLIVTEMQYSFDPIEIFEINKAKQENLLNFNEIPKCPPEYKHLCNIYKEFLEYLPESRPDINQVTKSMINYLYLFLINNYNDENAILLKELMQYLLFLASQNNAESQFVLSLIYCFDNFGCCNVNKGVSYLILSANNNCSEAQYYLGYIYYKGIFISRDINKAINYLTLSANQNDSNAQFTLGEIYFNGSFVDKDINKALYYLKQSSDQNNSDAQYLIAVIYFSDENEQYNIDKAIHYFTISSNQNNPQAQFCLGVLYYHGVFLEKNFKKAFDYFRLSADKGLPESKFYLGKIYYEGIYITRDINKSIDYITQSAKESFPDALYYLGFIFYEGKYIKRDINKAIYYLELSANQNNTDAQYYLGLIFYKGEYIPKDINKSIHYFTISAKQNDARSQYSLGEMYYLGSDISRDINKSIYYLTLSANQNCDSAQLLLGYIFYDGTFIIRDINQSNIYLFHLRKIIIILNIYLVKYIWMVYLFHKILINQYII